MAGVRDPGHGPAPSPGRGDLAKAQRIAEELLERWAGSIRGFVARHAYAPEASADLRQDIHTRLWWELRGGSQDFWEANFIHSLACLCRDAAKPLARRATREGPMPTQRDEDGSEQPQELADQSAPGLLDELLRQEHADALRLLLAGLPEQQRTALYLRYLRGWPLASKDPEVITVSGAMGVSDRMVRHYLRDGEARLRTLYQEQVHAAQ